MIAALRQRNFAFLWIGQLISMIGDWVLLVALPFYVYSLTGSTFATGVMFIVQTVPRLVFGSVAGVFVDRWNRKYTMFCAELVQTVVLLPLFFVQSQEWVWIVYVFAFIESMVSQFFIPAKSAIIPHLVEEKHLLAANSLNSMSQELTRLVGPFLGGMLLAVLGINSVIIVDCTSFLLSAIMIALIVLPKKREENGEIEEERQEEREGRKAALVKVWREWVEGMRLVRRERLIAAILLIVGVAMVGEGLIEVLLVAYVKLVLHGTALVLGWLMTAQAIGGVLGSFVIVRLSKYLSPAKLIGICGVAFGALIAVFVNTPSLAIVLPGIALCGLTVIGFFVSLLTLLQSNVTDEYRGRIFGTFNTVQAFTMLIGMALASGLGDHVGVVPLLDVDAAFNILAGVLAFVLLRGATQVAPAAEKQEELVADLMEV